LWRQLAAAGDPEGERTIRLGRAMGELALYQYRSGDPYAARETYEGMRRLYVDPNGRVKDAGWRAHGLAKIHLGLGEIERLANNYADARREYAETVRYITAALALKPDELSWIQMLMTAQNDIGVVCMHEKNFAAAEASFLRAVDPNRRLIRLEPKNRRWEKELATTLQNPGALMHLQAGVHALACFHGNGALKGGHQTLQSRQNENCCSISRFSSPPSHPIESAT
jgi:tetratricopeptide (TPR) repeat protein